MATGPGLRGKFKEILVKYGKVALGVHFSVSAASITGIYIAIKNNVDVESLFDKFHIAGVFNNKDSPQNQQQNQELRDGSLTDQEMIKNSGEPAAVVEEKRNRMAELAASSGGAFALAVLCNKALFPVRVPITVVLTPPVARFLARRSIISKRV